ncbi:putative periplasmic lipoprotein [Paenibacillus sp. MAH-36]|uniref:Uncharacterized protein n=1 Tax=Paenibacillus violae TaxID=3077234 RepID=A0ABU3RNI2_9BACL|nr:hypothetical protein [Paenibacillus sp. PFR10]MDU0205845.1 hypothetical protein [Paenibacillus sp. PFR10]
MRKILITIYCLFVLSACSNENKVHPLIDALNSEGIHVTEINTSEDAILGVKGIVFKLDNDEIIRVYDFGSKENRVKGEKNLKIIRNS